MKGFYMVFMEYGNTPAYKHDCYEDAEREAKRLAREFGRKTYVLTTVKSFESVEFKTEDLMPEMNQLPF